MSCCDVFRITEISISTNLELRDHTCSRDDETGRDPQKVKEALRKLMYVMLEEAEKNYGKEFNTLTNLTGNNGAKLSNAVPYMMSEFNHVATVVAISMGESNASMGRIVACPTAGSCGVMPGALYALKYVKKASDDELLKSFIVASGIGNVVAKRATLSGAAGGCRAEIGTATAMASSMITYFSRDPVKGQCCSHFFEIIDGTCM